MNTNKIIHAAATAGRIILENGGETYRVEETFRRICSAYSLKKSDCYVTLTGIMLSAEDEDGTNISLVKRIHNRTVNLEKISLVNNLSRQIESKKLTIDEVTIELEKIENTNKYNNKTLILFAAIGSSFFSQLFGGNCHDFLASFFIGGIIQSIYLVLSRINVNNFFINAVGGAIASLLAVLSVKCGIGTNVDKIIIGSIMLLVPGLAITNAIRDFIAGDLISGLARGIEAFLVAIAIAVGSGMVLKIFISYYGGFVI